MRFILSILMLLALSAKAQFNFGNAFYVAGTIGAVSSGNPPVAGFTFWVHADDPTGLFTNNTHTVGTVANANPGREVAYWTDRSAIGTNSVWNNLPNVVDSRPYLSNNVFNGKPAVWFGNSAGNSLGKLLTSPTNNITFGIATGFTVFVACSFESVDCGAFGMLCSLQRTAASFYDMRQESTTKRIQVNDDIVSVSLSRLMTNGVGYCHTYRNWIKGNTDSPGGANGTIQMGRNGQFTNVTESTFTAPTTNWFAIGTRGVFPIANDLHWGGYIAEVIVYPWALNDTDYQLVTKYVTNKYNFVLF